VRTEDDYLGKREIPDDAFYGIHALRARENFPDRTPFPLEWYRAAGIVKQACYLTYRDFKKASLEKYSPDRIPFKPFPDEVIEALVEAAAEVALGNHFSHFIVPAISGGAGTSINMNVNEIIANVALVKLGKKPGDYKIIDPIEHANVFQSTNDVIPTSLKVAVMNLLNELEPAINHMRSGIEHLETTYRNDLRIGYTQMQEAVPTSFGKLFGAYNEALSRDWWRVSKCFERIKTVNLGGSAIGTGLAVPRFFIMEAIRHLQALTSLPVNRSENLPDATSNLDSFVEVHATLKAHAVNLEKMVSDIRLLASDIANVTSRPVTVGQPGSGDQTGWNSHQEVIIPQRQVGSTVMPAKINPVIPEFVISAVHRIYANDQLIASLAGQGCLELNAYLPVTGHAMIESIRLLTDCNRTLQTNLFDGLTIHPETSHEKLLHSPAITTALIPYIGYHKASRLARLMKEKGISIVEANRDAGIMKDEKLLGIIKPENLLKLGYLLDDLTG